MEILKEKILKYGKVYPGNILKVDNFLNHQIDIPLMAEIGEEFAKRFSHSKATKILTVEASGIAVACFVAKAMEINNILFAKKSTTKNLSKDIYTEKIMSYTHGKVYDIFICKDYINASDKVLIIDDFLANGEAFRGLISLVEQAGAEVVGLGAVIEKGFQGGGDKLRKAGYVVESLAIVDEMTDNSLIFRK
ncbi:MAG: xanthine phosphoribosyltransferase [Clostridia bacterium]